MKVQATLSAYNENIIHAICFASLFNLDFSRSVSWRGSVYDVMGSSDGTMKDYFGRLRIYDFVFYY